MTTIDAFTGQAEVLASTISKLDGLLKDTNDLGEATDFCRQRAELLDDALAQITMLHRRARSLKRRIEQHQLLCVVDGASRPALSAQPKRSGPTA